MSGPASNSPAMEALISKARCRRSSGFMPGQYTFVQGRVAVRKSPLFSSTT